MKSQNISLQYHSRTDIFGPLVAGRECGECSMCCTFTKIDTPEISKPMGATCQHCSNAGCTIYEDRYPVCRDWQCIWKHVEAMPADTSPDQLGLMFVLDQTENPDNILTALCIRVIIVDSIKASNHALAEPLIDMFCQGDLPVWLDDLTGELALLHPDVDIARCVLTDATCRDIEFDAETISTARSWNTGVRTE